MSAVQLIPADGPADPPSSRPRAGVLRGQVFAFSFDPSAGEQRVDVPGLAGIRVTPDTVLHWAFYADGVEATLAPHAALAVTVDVRGADDARLGEIAAVRDRYDFPLTATAQFAPQPSPGIGDRSVLQVMPFDGRPMSGHAERRRWITPGSERARPHEYSVDLGGLRAEMTATSHAAAFRVHGADPDATVGFVIDQPSDEGRLIWTDADGFEGWTPEGPEDWGNAPRCYFAGVVLRGEGDGSSGTRGALDDDGRIRVAGYVGGRGSLEVRVAVSFLSVEQARRSLAL